LLFIFLAVNFFSGFYTTLIAPMILAKTNNNAVFLGMVESSFGIGGIAGGILMTAWGGAKKKVISLLSGILISGIGAIILGLSRGLIAFLIACSIIGISGVIANASSQAIWQFKVPPSLQGRVFSARKVVAQLAGIIPMASSGIIVDRFLTPAFFNNTTKLSSIFGQSKGGAIALLAFVGGIFEVIVPIIGFLSPIIMKEEEIRPTA